MKAVAYCRYSSDNQDYASIDAQSRAILDYCSKNGYSLVKIYVDEAKTATKDDRPEFLRMISDSNNGLFDAVIVHKLDRFARNRYDSAFYRRELKKHGVTVMSVLELMDDSPESIILESVLEGMAEYFSKNLAREVRKGLKEAALQCRHTGGAPAYGYRIVNKKHEVNETEAQAIRMMFSLAAQGVSYPMILQAMEDSGFTTRAGKPFSRNTLHDIFKNERYMGTYVYNRIAPMRPDGTRSSRRTNPEEEIIRVPGGIPAIVPEDTFMRVRARMADRTQKGRSSSKHIYVLSGLLECGICGRAMIGGPSRTNGDGTRYYKYYCSSMKQLHPCGNRVVPAEQIEEMVLDKIRSQFFDQSRLAEIVEEIIADAADSTDEKKARVAQAKRVVTEIEKQIGNITGAIAQGMFHQSMIQTMNDLEKRRSAALSELHEAENSAYPDAPDIDSIRRHIEANSLDNAKSPENLREIIRAFIGKVVVTPATADITTTVSVVGASKRTRTSTS